jgi:glycosyltransferase involved in cell wall biosynthesis
MSGAARSSPREVRHVIMVTNALAPDKLGGLERYVRELAAGLVRQGLAVTVLAKRVHPEHPAREVACDGVSIVRHDVPSKRLRTFALRYPLHVATAVGREVGEPGPGTVVHAHYAMPALPLALRGMPYLYTFHAPVYREALAERQGSYALPRAVQAPAVAGLKAAESFVVRRASRVLALSRYMQDELALLSRRAAASSVLVPGGIDTDRFSPGPARRDDWASGAEPLLFAARRLTPRTGVLELVQAMPAVLRRFPRAQLAVAGEGHMMPAIEDAIRRLGLEPAVRLLGRIGDEALVGWYRLATVSVMPTQSLEGFGLSTAECLACGTPVVATPLGANPELLRPLDPRLLAGGSTPDDLSAAICQIVGTSSVLSDVRARARDHVHPSMSWDAIARRHIGCYAAAARQASAQVPEPARDPG